MLLMPNGKPQPPTAQPVAGQQPQPAGPPKSQGPAKGPVQGQPPKGHPQDPQATGVQQQPPGQTWTPGINPNAPHPSFEGTWTPGINPMVPHPSQVGGRTNTAGQQLDRMSPNAPSSAIPYATPTAMPQIAGGTTNPEQALNQVRQQFMSRHGRPMSPQEEQQLISQSGYSGGQVSSQQLQSALSSISGPQGGPLQGWRGPTQQPSGQYQQPADLPQPTVNPQAQSLMSSILGNPQTMNQQWQDQQFEGQKELANSLRTQFQDQAAQRMAGMGRSAGSGVQQSIMSDIDQDFASQLLGARRDISGRAAVQNRADEYNALGANEAFEQGNFGRLLGTGAFNAGNLNNANQFGLQSWLAENNLGLERDRLDTISNQFRQTYGLDLMRFLEDQRQFNAQLGQGNQQFNDTMGLNWYNAQGNQSNQLMNYFMNYLR